MLFHEIYGCYYLAAAAILKEAAAGGLTGKRLNALVAEHAFGESLLSIPEGIRGERWKLLREDLSPALRAEPGMPLTTLEKRWMKALSLDPRFRLFEPDLTGLEAVEPLFTPDAAVYYDRYTNGDDYRDPGYIRRFRTILQALREERDLFIRFVSGRKAVRELTVTPHLLEYSEKDDRFRLVAAGRKRRWVINLSRVTDCALAFSDSHMPLKKPETSAVTFELEDRRNALNRVLLHFSHLEKETKKLDSRRYRVTLRYDPEDETEMVIRILSFGPALRVTEPERFIGLIRERIGKQVKLAPFLPGKDGASGV